MQFHSDIGVLSDRNSHRRVAQRAYPKRISKPGGDIGIQVGEGLTGWGNTIMLALVILLALVGGRKVMLATELVFAMLTFERQEIDKVAVLS